MPSLRIKRSLAALSTARASRRPRPATRARLAPHVYGWLALALLAFLQPPGRIAADTKFNLTANPAGFLAGALHAWTDQFPLGQMQNQASGYLFPQGAFFLAAHAAHVPAWVSQRLWWALLLSLAYSGTLTLARRLGISGAPAVTAAVCYALSPRVITTLTAISSEAWPVALVPWTLVPLVGRRPNAAAAIVPVALMGGVNATATAAACVPAGLYLLARREPRAAARFAAGALTVSAWWIGPLFVLGRYSPPFTEFIESASVTTAWLNPVEILRGTTSWSTFVETERAAGFLLVAEPTFIIATCAVAALGLVGLARADFPQRREFVLVFAVGFWVLASAYLGISLYDASLAPLRNLHKFDSLVRLPLALGAGWALAYCRPPQLAAALTAVVVAIAPAWSLRLLPEGAYQEVSPDWVAAGEWLDQHADATRTLVLPATSFARQEWGWTRDEPIQALTHTRFAFRDAIPLVDPEAIRGLDGQTQAPDPEALRSIGVGAVVVRHDLDNGPDAPDMAGFGEPAVSFGKLDIYMLEPARDMMLAANDPLTVDGGGEVLPLLWHELGYFPARLSGEAGRQPDTAADTAPDIVTDTPALAARNYGTLRGPLSAHLTGWDEDTTVANRLKDYPSAGTRVGVSTNGSARASSSAADAGAFGGAEPAKSLTAAFDGLADTAWRPAPGDKDPWIEVEPIGDAAGTRTVAFTATEDTKVEVSSPADPSAPARTLSLVGGQARTVTVPGGDGDGGGGPVRIRLTEPAGADGPVGIAEIKAGVSRIVEVPGTADTYFFQRRFPATDVIQRRFTLASGGTWRLSEPATIDGAEHEAGPVDLDAGTHDLVSDAETVMLTRGLPELPRWQAFAGTAAPASGDRLILTTRGANSGLRASVGGTELEPVPIDASAQAFLLPAGASGEFKMWHAGEAAYQTSLLFGAVLALAVTGTCLWVPWPRFEPRRTRRAEDRAALQATAQATPLAVAAAVVASHPLPGALAAALAWATRRGTGLRATWLTGGALMVSGLVLARAPWPSANYAGNSRFLIFCGCFAVACLAFPDAPDQPRTRRAPGTSTSS